MDAEQLRQMLGTAHERQNIELKSAGPYDHRSGHTARLVKAALGLSNLRDGGYVVLGVSESPQTGISLDGLSQDDLNTWNADKLSTLLNNHADPSVQLTLHFVDLDGKNYVVVRVEPFAETPTVCKKELSSGGELILRNGALYVRPRRKAETAEVSTSEDMRALLQLALEKRLADYVATAERAEVELVPVGQRRSPLAGDESAYSRELGDLNAF